MNIYHPFIAFEKILNHRWMVIVRIGLGICLFIKGIQFVENNSIIRKVFSESLLLQNYYWLQMFIPWIHLLGGVFIIIGLFTRFAVLIQIPIVICAIIFVNTNKGIFEGEKNLFLSIVILILLIVFLIEGGGHLSWDKYLKNDRKKKKYDD
jgi:uncharacterized membrane protein YphA (DoxX/SURF4 family)